MNQPIRTMVPTGVVLGLILLLFLGACGEEEKRANQAVQWLELYSKANPPNREWLMTNVNIDEHGRVVMNVQVPDRGQIDLIKARTRIEQIHIVRMACPPKDSEIWTILSAKQLLWVNLLEEKPDGLIESITGALCKP